MGLCFLFVDLASLPYDMKCTEATAVVIFCYINKIEKKKYWIDTIKSNTFFYPLKSVCSPLNCVMFLNENVYFKLYYDKCLNLFCVD